MKYIIDVKDNETLYKAVIGDDGEPYIIPAIGNVYKGPDLYAIRNYDNALNAAWDAARKIAKMNTDEQKRVFGCFGIYFIAHEFSACEAIEKIRQYEKEKEEEKEADLGKVRDVLRTTAKECHVTFDEIEEVLSGIMGEKTDEQE